MKAHEEIARLQAKIESGEMSPDEPLFCLRAQDVLAPNIVIEWSGEALKAGTPTAKCNEAIALAWQMKEWEGPKQVPGRPDLKEVNDLT